MRLTGNAPTVTVSPGVASRFNVNTATSGSHVLVTVTALDAFGNVASGFTGTVHVASATTAIQPFNYTFVATDHGQHTFTLASAADVVVTNMLTVSGSTPGNAAVQANVNLAPGQWAGLLSRYAGPGDNNTYLGVVSYVADKLESFIYLNHNGELAKAGDRHDVQRRARHAGV